jgi:hypothetical protein
MISRNLKMQNFEPIFEPVKPIQIFQKYYHVIVLLEMITTIYNMSILRKPQCRNPPTLSVGGFK